MMCTRSICVYGQGCVCVCVYVESSLELVGVSF
jgi:hypothetical protein